MLKPIDAVGDGADWVVWFYLLAELDDNIDHRQECVLPVLGYRLPTPCIPYRLSRFSHSIISVSDSSYLCIPLNGRIDYLPRREKVQLDQCVAEGS